MTLTKKVFKSEDQLKKHLRTHQPSFYHSSQTSTVVPYNQIEEYFEGDLYWCDLSHMQSNMALKKNGNLIVKGSVSWKEAREFLRPKGRNIMTAPTEELALIAAGAATSATGERSFTYGTLREQIQSINYLDFDGEEHVLKSCNFLKGLNLSNYQKEYERYNGFKNGPFPRLLKETDLLIGTEGQLGVITQVEIKTCQEENLSHLFLLLPEWEEDYTPHLEILHRIQKFRDCVNLCEFVDHNSFDNLPKEKRPNRGGDVIFLEIKEDAFERFYQEFLMELDLTPEENVFELSEGKFHSIRASIPRAVFEVNSKMGVTKTGTDIQVKVSNFKTLLDCYRGLARLPVKYNLFGHFGDCHLHFNYMPKPESMDACKKEFEQLYEKVCALGASPFAEHGIGVLKKKYISRFWTDVQVDVFKQLKEIHDPYNQFFPQGFMSLRP